MSIVFQKKNNWAYSPTHSVRPRLDIMIEQLLPSTFVPQIWEKISSLPASEFMRNQEDIKNILLTDSKLFQSFFPRFYRNHQSLNNWYMLANSNQLEMKKYVFNSLLSKKYREYRQMMKQMFPDCRYNRTQQAFREDRIEKDIKHQSFHRSYLKNCRTDLVGKKEEKKIQQGQWKWENKENGELEKEDYHDLFLKTFSACDGSKYIYYDFNRHMKGVDEKKKYNQFIRIKKHKISNSNLAGMITQPQCLKKWEDAVKSASSSFYGQQQNPLFHEGEELLEGLKYCNVTMGAQGEIEKSKYIRELMWLRKTAGGLKRVVAHKPPSKFQIRLKKIL